MAYKDKDKQREAQREWVRQKRAAKGSTDTLSSEAESLQHKSGSDTESIKQANKIVKRGKDIKCFADLHPSIQDTIVKMSTINGKVDNDEWNKRTVAAIKYQHLFPDKYEPHGAVCTGVVTGKPGDEDYNGVCTEAWRTERGR